MRKNKRKRTTAGVLLCLFLLLFSFPAAAQEGQEPAQAEAAETQNSDDTPGEGAEAPTEEDPAAQLPVVRPAGEGQGLYLPPFEPAAAAVCLVSEDTGLTVYEKNADAPMVAASLVKLMTAILTMDNVEDLDAVTVTADSDWVFDALYGLNASLADIKKGETLTVRELLYAMLLPSGNEAALLLADHISGGYVENFLFMMNGRAEALGCTGTQFADPNGLSESNITTARDMSLIMREFCQYPELMEIAGTPTYEMAQHEAHSAPYNLFNTNRLLVETSPYYSAFPASAGRVVAGKTGRLGEWQNFASMAQSEEAKYICTVLNSPDEADVLGASFEVPQARPALYESAQLYDWAFSYLSVRPALDTTQPITEVPLRYCMDSDSLKLLPSSDLQALLPVEDTGCEVEMDLSFSVPESVSAPVSEGDAVGSVTVTLGLDGEVVGVIGTAELYAAEGAERNNTLYAVRRVQEFFGSTYFKVLLGVIALAVLLYIGLVVLVGYLAEQKKARGGRQNKKR
ncbi:serine hydrolase [Ruminococcaceae bacterium OttesenSCG-928-I18]|nr:serine hydrolase [Ruminococcaceae bacterium OttesenSCG-928-I18]